MCWICFAGERNVDDLLATTQKLQQYCNDFWQSWPWRIWVTKSLRWTRLTLRTWQVSPNQLSSNYHCKLHAGQIDRRLLWRLESSGYREWFSLNQSSLSLGRIKIIRGQLVGLIVNGIERLVHLAKPLAITKAQICCPSHVCDVTTNVATFMWQTRRVGCTVTEAH